MLNEIIEVIKFLSKVGELILQMRYDQGHFQMNHLLNQNAENIKHHEGQFGFALRSEYYGFIKSLSEIFSQQQHGNRYFNIQFFLQRKQDGMNFLIESWEFELYDRHSSQNINSSGNNNGSLLALFKDKVKKETVQMDFAIAARQIAILLVQSSLWNDYMQIGKDNLLFQTFRLKHFLDYKVSYFQLDHQNKWPSNSQANLIKLKNIQISESLMLNIYKREVKDMAILRNVPLLNKHQVQKNINQMKMRERYLSDDIFNNNSNEVEEELDDDLNGNKQNAKQQEKQQSYGYNNSTHMQQESIEQHFKKKRQMFKQMANNSKVTNNNNSSSNAAAMTKFLSCGKLDDDNNNTNNSDQNSNSKIKNKSQFNKCNNSESNNNNNGNSDQNSYQQQKQTIIDAEDISNIEIVQHSAVYDSIVSMYSKKDDITIVSTPDDLRIQTPHDEEDEEENEEFEFEMCGNFDSVSQNENNNASQKQLQEQDQDEEGKQQKDKEEDEINNSGKDNLMHREKFFTFIETILQDIELQMIEMEGNQNLVTGKSDLQQIAQFYNIKI